MSPEEKADKRISDLQAATREANLVLADIKQVLKEVRGLHASIGPESKRMFEELLAEEVNRGLDEYKKSLETAIETATQAVFDRFETIRKTLLGETKQDKKAGRASIPEIIENQWCPQHLKTKGDCWELHK
jgi:DNA-binding transcriptional MerR regulator